MFSYNNLLLRLEHRQSLSVCKYMAKKNKITLMVYI